MSTTPAYLIEVKELIEAYGLEALADIMGKTTRGIQYWTSETDPKVPGPSTQRTIHELFVKHKKGENLNLTVDADYKDKYIASLEKQIRNLEKEAEDLRARLNSCENHIRETLLLTHSIAGTNQDSLAQIMEKLKIGTVEKLTEQHRTANLALYTRRKADLGIQ